MSTKATSQQQQRRVAAIAQLRSTSNKLENLVHVAQCAGWAQQQRAQMLFLPECFGFLGESFDQTLELAEPPIEMESGGQVETNQEEISKLLQETVAACAGGADRASDSNLIKTTTSESVFILAALKTIARASGLWISAGGMHVAGAPPSPDDDNPQRGRVYNTHVILDQEGQVQCLYRKIHLFDVSIPNQVNLRESATTAPGTELVVCESPIGTLGLSTCYDVRFNEMYIPLVRDMGAQILLVPSAFTVPTGRAHWHTLLRARSIEHQCYVFAAAQYGQHNNKRESYGHSLAVDPWGNVVADAGGCDGPGTVEKEETSTPSIVICNVDLEQLESIRQRMPIQQHRTNAKF